MGKTTNLNCLAGFQPSTVATLVRGFCSEFNFAGIQLREFKQAFRPTGACVTGRGGMGSGPELFKFA